MRFPQYIKWIKSVYLHTDDVEYGIVSINPKWETSALNNEKYVIHYSNGVTGYASEYIEIETHEELMEISEEEYLTSLIMES